MVVKKCICHMHGDGEDNRAVYWFGAVIFSLLPVVVFVIYGPYAAAGAIAGYWLIVGLIGLLYLMGGHSVKCSARQGLLSVLGVARWVSF